MTSYDCNDFDHRIYHKAHIRKNDNDMNTNLLYYSRLNNHQTEKTKQQSTQNAYTLTKHNKSDEPSQQPK